MNKYLVRSWHLIRRDARLRRYLESCVASGQPPRLHVGCGNRPIAGWYNADVSSLSGEVHYVDALKRLPFETGTFQYVFSEHFIEHLSFEDGLKFFREAHRVLKPGGVLRTATPDLKFLNRLYEDRRSEPHRRYIDFISSNFDSDKPASAVACTNRAFYGWGHRYIYDAEFLEQVLAPLGFGEFRALKPGQSAHAHLKDLEQHGKSVPPEINELETFVLEAVKR